LTVVEEVQNVSAANAQARMASVIKTRRPRLSLREKQEIAGLYADTCTSTSEICARLGIGESSLYRIVQLQGVPLRGRTASSVSAGTPTRPVPAPARTQHRLSDAGRRLGAKRATSGAANGQVIASEACGSSSRRCAVGGVAAPSSRASAATTHCGTQAALADNRDLADCAALIHAARTCRRVLGYDSPSPATTPRGINRSGCRYAGETSADLNRCTRADAVAGHHHSARPRAS